MPEIENLSIQISANETQAVDGLEKLARTLERLKNAVNGAAPTKSEAGRLRDFGQALNALRGAENIRISSTIATQIGRIGTAIGRITTSDIQRIRELGDALRGLNGAGNGANVDLRVAGNNGQQVAQAVNAGAVAPVVAPVENMGGAIQPVVDDIADAAGATDDSADAANKASERFSAFAGVLNRGLGFAINNTLGGIRWLGRETIALSRSLGKSLVGGIKDSVRGFTQFFNSIKRIALYRAIRSALRMITQGFSEGMQNLYAWSSAVNGSFAASMDRLATASLYMKNSMAAMVSPLIESLAPAIDFVIDKFVDLFNVINQVFATLSGKASYTAAKKVASQWKDAEQDVSGSARKATKDIKRTILGFDEINKLNGDNGNGGGSGSGSGSANASSMMFENRSISNWIRDMVNNSDFSLLGQTIAEKINSALASINWSNIRSKAIGITDSITSMLNGFITSIDPLVIGESLAEVINTGATVVDRFWSSVKWAEAGRKTRAAINQFFQKIDVEKAADALTGKFRSIVTYIANALPQTPEEWDLIGKKISGFITRALNRIPWPTLGNIIGNLLVGGMRVMTILADNMTLTKIATGIKTAIQKACEKITPEEVAHLVNSVLKDVLSAVGVLLSIDIKFGDVSINPIALVSFAWVATSLIKKSLGSIFGSTTVGGLGKGLLYAASFTLALQAIVDLVETIGNEGISWGNIRKILSDSLTVLGAALLYVNPVAGAVALGLGVILRLKVMDTFLEGLGEGATNIWDWVTGKKSWGEIFDSHAEDYTIPLANPDTYSGNSNSFKKGTSLSRKQNLSMDVDVNFTSADNPTYKNKTLGNYLVNSMSKVKAEAQTKVNAVAGAFMKLVNSGLAPVTSDTTTKNVVYALAGSGMANANASGLAPVTFDTTTTNTVYAAPGAGIVKNGDGYIPRVSDTITTNVVKAAPGAGMVYSWDGYVPNVSDTITNNVVKAVPGEGMVYTWDGFMPDVNDTSVTVDVEAEPVWGWWGSLTRYLGIDRLTATVDVVVNASGAFKTFSSLTSALVGRRAMGGVYSNGKWSDIPQYAGGNYNVAHGSLFWAGEKGAEIVGNANGRTEVLNKSQIAAAMYAAVSAAMAPAAANFAVAAQNMSNANDGMDNETLSDMIQQAVENAMSRSNDYDRQKVELLRQISDKDFSAEITTSSMNKAQTRMNRRAGVTLVPVGT